MRGLTINGLLDGVIALLLIVSPLNTHWYSVDTSFSCNLLPMHHITDLLHIHSVRAWF